MLRGTCEIVGFTGGLKRDGPQLHEGLMAKVRRFCCCSQIHHMSPPIDSMESSMSPGAVWYDEGDDLGPKRTTELGMVIAESRICANFLACLDTSQ